MPAPLDVLNVAVGGLSQIMNNTNGQPIWTISPRPQRIPNESDGYSVLATSYYPVAGKTYSVELGLKAIGQGSLGTRLVVVLQDTSGWAVVAAENDADAAMQAIALFLDRIPNDGWRMVQGRWRYPHKFNVPEITEPQTQRFSPAEPDDDALPEGLLDSPTDKLFRNVLPGIEPHAVTDLLDGALRDRWSIEHSSFGVELTLLARNRAWPARILGIAASCAPVNGGALLTIRFGDKDCWVAPEAREALDDSMTRITAALRTYFSELLLESWTIPNS
jgi:hypothetical protein